jgi:hypothetical protein
MSKASGQRCSASQTWLWCEERGGGDWCGRLLFAIPRGGRPRGVAPACEFGGLSHLAARGLRGARAEPTATFWSPASARVPMGRALRCVSELVWLPSARRPARRSVVRQRSFHVEASSSTCRSPLGSDG